MKGCYYLKPAKTTTAPRAVVSIAIQPRAAERETRKASEPVGFGEAYAAFSRWRNGRWEDERKLRFVDPDSLHEWLEQWCEPRRKTFVFAPIASNALTVSRFWERVERSGARWDRGAAGPGAHGGVRVRVGRYTFTRRITRGVPDIVSYTVADRYITWLSGRQFFSGSDAELLQLAALTRK